MNDEAYTFDDNGNRITANGDSYTTTANNRLASDGTYNYEYDAEGNRIRRITLVVGNPTGATTEYGYDHRNRLISVVEKTSPIGTVTKEVEYAYDAFDRRIQKVIDADGAGANAPATTTYIHDGQAIVLSFDGDDNLTHRYLYGDAVDQLFADESATGDVLWGLTDNQNTPRDIVEYDADTDTTTVANHISYDGFGRVASETAAAVDYLLGFQGMERDEETGLFHADHREYDPQTGSWTQEDKIGFAGGAMKLDEFVGNSPTNMSDPSGLASEGHHWMPINIIAKLKEQGVLNDSEYEYFAGRMTGGLTAGHPNFNTKEHICYNNAVEQELRNWKSDKRTNLTMDQVVDNIKAGKTWDGKGTNKIINDFNSKVKKHIVDKNFDALTDEAKIRERGRRSLRGRGKLLAIIGILAGTTAIADKCAQANDVARILSEGEAMRRALDAAMQGDRSRLMLSLIGMGHPNPSVYEELMNVDLKFALTFRSAVEAGLAKDE